MPIYEYECGPCGTLSERLRAISKMNDEALCPKCDGESRRVLSVFSAVTSTADGGVGAIAGAGGGCGGCGPGGCACAG